MNIRYCSTKNAILIKTRCAERAIKNLVGIIIFTGLVFISGLTYSQEDSDVVNLGTIVKGNQEQPKVFYIIPWKPAKDHTILYQPLTSKLDVLFGHVERREHRRQVEFLDELTHNSQNNN